MRLHRNSQKRWYLPDGIYFITMVTKNRYEYFHEHVFCRLFIAELALCQELYDFKTPAYKINPEHIHLLLKPCKNQDYPRIMASLKRNFTKNCNSIIQGVPIIKTENPHDTIKNRSIITHLENLAPLQEEYATKYKKCQHPPFKWQKSYYCHAIMNKCDLKNHINYIRKQWIKHNQNENLWCRLPQDWGTPPT